MSLTLKGFSQDVVLEDRNSIQHFLVFGKEDGSEVRLPVPKETTEELIRLVYVQPSPPLHKLAEDSIADSGDESVADGATEFGAEDPDLEEDDGIEDEDEDGPYDESEVPSL